MKVWLLNPPFGKLVIREGRCQQEAKTLGSLFPPLTLVQLAAIFRDAGHQVSVLDCIGDEITEEKLRRIYSKENPDMVFASTITMTFNSDTDLADSFQKLHKAKWYIFGAHASYFSDKESSVNYQLIDGIPEKKACEILGKPFDFNNLPLPAWDLVDTSQYKMTLTKKPFILIQTSLGCSFSCSFCVAPRYYGKKVFKKDINKVIAEIKHAKSLGVIDILFFSDTFTLDRDYTIKLCEEISELDFKVRWMCNSRIDTIDKELAMAMKKAGCWLMALGIENLDQEWLDRHEKKLKASRIKEQLEILKGLNIQTMGHFILDTNRSPFSYFSLFHKTSKLPLDFAVFYPLIPFPGAPIFDERQDKDSEWEKYSYEQYSPKISVYKQIGQIYFFMSPKRILNILRLGLERWS